MPCGIRACLHRNPRLFQTFFPNYSILTVPSHELYRLLPQSSVFGFIQSFFFLLLLFFFAESEPFPSVNPSMITKADSLL